MEKRDDEKKRPRESYIDIRLAEREIRDFLMNNLDLIEPGLQLYVGEFRTGREYDTGYAGRIDLLCVRPSGDFVVIEIKRECANDRVVGQILRYMGWVKQNLANGKEVHGIIIAPDKDRTLELATSNAKNVSIKYYKLKLEIADG